jgi:hypothetical protein
MFEDYFVKLYFVFWHVGLMVFDHLSLCILGQPRGITVFLLMDLEKMNCAYLYFKEEI